MIIQKEKSTKRFGYFYKNKQYYKVVTGKGTLVIVKMSKDYLLPKEEFSIQNEGINFRGKWFYWKCIS